MNYRLGVFGFFSDPELTKESDRNASRNDGLMDQTASLLARGLFHRAIGESDAFFTNQALEKFRKSLSLFGDTWPGLRRTLAESEAADGKFAESIGPRSLAELRAKPAQELLDGAPFGASCGVSVVVAL